MIVRSHIEYLVDIEGARHLVPVEFLHHLEVHVHCERGSLVLKKGRRVILYQMPKHSVAGGKVGIERMNIPGLVHVGVGIFAVGH